MQPSRAARGLCVLQPLCDALSALPPLCSSVLRPQPWPRAHRCGPSLLVTQPSGDDKPVLSWLFVTSCPRTPYREHTRPDHSTLLPTRSSCWASYSWLKRNLLTPDFDVPQVFASSAIRESEGETHTVCKNAGAAHFYQNISFPLDLRESK